MRILIVDSYYPAVLAEAEPRMSGKYQDALQFLLGLRFGTSDFHSKHLRGLGWEAEDVIANSRPLLERFCKERGVPFVSCEETVLFMADLKPYDVIYMQSIHLFSRASLDRLSKRCKFLVGQCSYATDEDWFSQYDAVFTSFPHYIDRIKARGARAFLCRLAFDPSVLSESIPPGGVRDLDVSFVGGIGYRNIWAKGQDVMEAVAREFPQFAWWGYGERNLDAGSPLRKAWKGPAWGIEMYRVYARSLIVVNRHGEIASGCANNMRMYEATGCGAALVTDRAKDLGQIFQTGVEVVDYETPEECVRKIKELLSDRERLGSIAGAGMGRTLREHTYASRMREVDAALRSLL